jgi:pimeloyl-ACP methyl ester carboxylesterase
MWENPSFAGFLRKLSSFSRLILLDRLGNGLSDRGSSNHAFEDEMDDVRCVLEAVGSERAAYFGCHIGGRLALLLAATHPDQVSAVVTFGSHPATLRDEDYPWGTTPEDREWVLAAVRDGPIGEGAAELLASVAPGEATDASVSHWWRMFVHTAASPAEMYDGIKSLGPVDIRQALGSVQAPVLVLHRSGDRSADVRASRYMAERLPDARLVELPGDDHFPFFGDQDSVVGLTQEFLTGALPVADPDRVLATVLFTDIVDSTRLAAEMGDRRWHRLLEEHQQAVRRDLARFRGQGQGPLPCRDGGDHVLADGEGPGRRGRLRLRDRGTRDLKGVPDRWQLYPVELAGR